jgi:integrase
MPKSRIETVAVTPGAPPGPAKQVSALAMAGEAWATIRSGGRESPSIIDSWTDLSPGRRRDLKIAVRTLETLSGKPLGSIPFEPKAIEGIFRRATPASGGLSAASFQSYRSWIRFCLRRLGLLAERRNDGTALSADWQAYAERLSVDRHWVRLKAFIAFCSAQGIAPAETSDEALHRYRDHLQKSDIKAAATQTARLAGKYWNQAIETIPGWSLPRLSPLQSDDRQYSLRFEQMPASFQEDVKRFEARMRPEPGAGLYARKDAGPLLRPATVKTRLNAVRLIVGALINCGKSPDEITNLAVLVEPQNIETALDWHFRRGNQKLGAHLGVLSSTLQVIAKYHVKLPDDQLQTALKLLKVAKPPRQKSITPRLSKLLKELEDPRRRAMLLHLPQHLMRLAEKKLSQHDPLCGVERSFPRLEAARLAALATAIEIELHLPIRMENLAQLQMGQHLVKLDSRRERFTHLIIQTSETKTSVPSECGLQKETAKLIERYVTAFRTFLPNSEGDFLFPARFTSESSRKKSGFGTAISKIIRQEIGLDMNPHAFRAFCGSVILEANPHAIEDVRLILGHTTFDTTLRFYRAIAPDQAAKRLGKLITSRRRETQLEVAAAYRGSRSRHSTRSHRTNPVAG